MATQWNIKHTPNVWPWPPFLLLAAVLLTYLVDRVVPLDVSGGSAVRALGIAVFIGGLAIDVWASITLQRAKTTILPHKKSDALVTDGPYAWSRNPIYLGNLLILSGIGLVLGSWWYVIFVPVLAAVTHILAIAREERHLKANFPEEWAAYSGRVRRWL